jgi:hypothetical protein
MFRPNLENPANKQTTMDLNQAELQRTEQLKELIDDTQMALLEIEQGQSLKFYTAYLNNTRALLCLFNLVIYKEHFIVLPGDEVVEKKHKNVKHLMAMEKQQDTQRKDTRVFSGLGPCIFKIDFAKLSPEYGETGSTQEEKVVSNEINTDVTVKNTQHHKMVVKARNESYELFRSRF